MISNNENPRHEQCPTGPESCCEYNKAQATGQKFNHKPPLHPDVAKNVLPNYEGLSNDDLLNRCLGGNTRNSNESFNASVWRLVATHLHAGRKVIGIAAFIAASVFNEGFSAILKVIETLNIMIGLTCKAYVKHVVDD